MSVIGTTYRSLNDVLIVMEQEGLQYERLSRQIRRPSLRLFDVGR